MLLHKINQEDFPKYYEEHEILTTSKYKVVDIVNKGIFVLDYTKDRPSAYVVGNDIIQLCILWERVKLSGNNFDIKEINKIIESMIRLSKYNEEFREQDFRG